MWAYRHLHQARLKPGHQNCIKSHLPPQQGPDPRMVSWLLQGLPNHGHWVWTQRERKKGRARTIPSVPSIVFLFCFPPRFIYLPSLWRVFIYELKPKNSTICTSGNWITKHRHKKTTSINGSKSDVKHWSGAASYVDADVSQCFLFPNIHS